MICFDPFAAFWGNFPQIQHQVKVAVLSYNISVKEVEAQWMDELLQLEV